MSTPTELLVSTPMVSTPFILKFFQTFPNLFFRLWNSVVEHPRFWQWARLTVDGGNQEAALLSDRVHIVPEIRIITVDCWQGNFLKIMENILTAVLDGRSHLKKLHVRAQSESKKLLSQAAVWSTLIGRSPTLLCSHWSRASLVMVAPALLCHKEPAKGTQSG